VIRAKVAYRAAWFGVVGAVIIAATIVPSARSADAAGCPNAEREPGVEPAFPESAFREVADDADIWFDDPSDELILQFDDSRTAQKDEVILVTVQGQEIPASGLNEEGGLIARFGGSQRLKGPGRHKLGPSERGIQKSIARESAHDLSLCLRIDPGQIKIAPGTYSGMLGVAYGDHMEMRASVPVVVSFRHGWLKAAVLVFLGVLLGLVVKILSEAAAIARTKGIGSREALRIYTSQLAFPVVVILSIIAGVFVYVVQYLHDPDWGADATDSLRLFATCFVLQMGSSEALGVVSRVAGGGTLLTPRNPGAA